MPTTGGISPPCRTADILSPLTGADQLEKDAIHGQS
jgi:hypothetical protein